MAWSNSKVFVSTIEDVWEDTAAIDLLAGTWNAALYTNSITPDQTVASAATAYDTGQWAVAQEVDDPTDWATGGEPVTGMVFTPTTNVLTLDATDTPQSGTTCTLAANYGCLLYMGSITTPVADQGLSFHYFGGEQQVTGGTYTIVWNASGVMTITA